MIKSRKKLFLARTIVPSTAIAITIFLSGCGGGVTAPMQQLNTGALIADFPNGAGFTSSVATGEVQAGYYSIIGTQNIPGEPPDELTLTVPINSVLPYTVTGTDNAEVVYYDALTSKSYDGNGAQGSCQITITQTSPTLEGTFSATTICNDSTVVLNNGAFNVSF